METPRLQLPLIAASQAQKHVPANESFKRLDALVHMSVMSMAETAPPGEPAEGDMYVAAAQATGAWEDGDLNLFLFTDGLWLKIVPFEGMLVWDCDQANLFVWTGEAWQEAGIQGPEGPAGASFQPVAVVAEIGDRDAFDEGPVFVEHPSGSGQLMRLSVLVESDATNDDQPTLYFLLAAAVDDPPAPAEWSQGFTFVSGGSGGSGDPPEIETFTADGTWEKPAGLRYVEVTVVGGGGGGAGAGVGNTRGGGAGGGAAVKIIAADALDSTVAVTVGPGGDGGSAGENNGQDGGTSSFGSHVSATGGQGGRATSGGVPVGGIGSDGDVNVRGGNGTHRSGNTGVGTSAGGNAALGYGTGAQAFYTTTNTVGQPAAGFGGGGGGATAPSTAQAGGNGTAGVVVVKSVF